MYTVTRNRLLLTRLSFDKLCRWAGIGFDHFVADNGSDDGTAEWLRERAETGQIKGLYLSPVNLGQNLATNYLLDLMKDGEPYDWVVRWDNDAIPRRKSVV